MKYCPTCECEYENHVEYCVDCAGKNFLVSDAELDEIRQSSRIDEDKRSAEHDQKGLVVVYTGTTVDSDLARCFLENNGINAFLADEQAGTVMPWHVGGGGALAVRVMVPGSEADQAISLLKDKEAEGLQE